MANGVRITPTINTVGVFKVEKPFFVESKRVYEVVAIREFDDIWLQGGDVYEEYYKPNGLSEEIYERDVKLGATIVTLKSKVGNVYIPDTFIESFPKLGYLNYKHVILSVDIGAVSDEINLDALIADLKELASKHVGVTAKVKKHTAPTTNALTRDEVKSLEKQRQGLRDIPESKELLYQETKRKLDMMNAANNAKLVKLQQAKTEADAQSNTAANTDLSTTIKLNEANMPKFNAPEFKAYLESGDWGTLNKGNLSNVLNSSAIFFDWYTSSKQTITKNPILQGNGDKSMSTRDKVITSFGYEIIDKYKNI